MTPDLALEELVTRLTNRTGRSRLEVLAVLADHIQRLRVNAEDTGEIAGRAAAVEQIAAAIEAGIERGVGRR